MGKIQFCELKMGETIAITCTQCILIYSSDSKHVFLRNSFLPHTGQSSSHPDKPGLKENPSSNKMNVATAFSIRILLFSFHKSTENRIRGQLSWGMRVNWPSLLSLHCALGAWTAHRHFQLERLSRLNLQCTERDMEI